MTTLTPTTPKNKLIACALALALGLSPLGFALGTPRAALADEATSEQVSDGSETSEVATTVADERVVDKPETTEANAPATAEPASNLDTSATKSDTPAPGAPATAEAADVDGMPDPDAPATAEDTGAADMPDPDAPVTSTLKMATPDLPLANKENLPEPTSDDEANHTMTFYYCEMMHYDDPEWIPNPSGNRLLYTRVVENLKVGDQLNTWDYVEVIDGYFFFDAIPARPVVSANEEDNYVELRYTNPELNKYTVNYYRVSDGEDCAETTSGPVVEELGGEQVAFECFKSETVDHQRFNLLVDGQKIARPVDDMMYVDSFPASIRVTTQPEKNVINLLYADTMTSLPDDVEITENGAGSGSDNGTDDEPETGNGPGSSENGGITSQPEESPAPDTDTGNGSAPDQDAPSTPETGAAPGATNVPEQNGAESSTDASDASGPSDFSGSPAESVPQPERPVGDGTLPQTGDPLATATGLAAFAAVVAAGAIAVARRQA